MNSDEYTQMSSYEFLKNFVETNDLITIVQYFKMINTTKSLWESHKRNEEALNGEQDELIKAILKSLAGYQNLSEKEEKIFSQEYEMVMKDWENLSVEPSIIDVIKNKIESLEYDLPYEYDEGLEGELEDEPEYELEGEKAKAETVVSISALLQISQVTGYCEKDEEEENPWQDVKDVIAEKLAQMNNDDFLITIEMGGIPELFHNEEYRKVLEDKIPEMDRYQFLRCANDTGDGMDGFSTEVKNVKAAQFDKLWKSNLSLFAFDVAYDRGRAEDILDNVSSSNILEILNSSNVFKSDEAQEKVVSLVKRLTPIQIVRYMYRSAGYESDKVKDILKLKLNELPDEDIKLLVSQYLTNRGRILEKEGEPRRVVLKNYIIPDDSNSVYKSLVNIAKQRKIVVDERVEKDLYTYMNLSEDEQKEYQDKLRYYSKVNVIQHRMPYLQASMGNLMETGRIDFDGVSQEEIMDVYNQGKEEIKASKEFLQTMEYYEGVSDILIMPQIIAINSRIPKEGIERNTDMKYSQEANRTMEYQEFFYNYFQNRILNMAPDKVKRLNSVINGGAFTKAMEEVLRYEKQNDLDENDTGR